MNNSSSGQMRPFALIASLIMLLTSFFIVCIFYWLYDSSKQNILGTWRNEMQQATKKIEQYMKMPMDAVAFSGVTLNAMLRDGKSHEEAGRYLIQETAIYSSIISENNTGVYAYYKGVYLDGSGWTPPPDYKPKERPWYTAAIEGKGSVVLVKPFYNLQTDTVMMSVSQLLDDNDSVVSMDIFLDSVQSMVQELVAAGSIIKTAFVLDRSGYVVAHSDRSYVGKPLEINDNPLHQDVVNTLREQGWKRTEFNGYEGKYTVFVEPIGSDWRAVYVLEESKLYTSLVIIYLASGFFLLFVIGICMLVFMSMSRKYAEAEHLHREIRAVATIYVAMLRVDLKNDTITSVQKNADIDAVLEGDFTKYSQRTASFAEKLAASQSQDLLTQFMDTETLEERLKGVNYITQEFMDKKEQWIRLRIIVIERNVAGSLRHILLAFESIDEDRKRQEKLRLLSETDLMTGIRNRGSGERLVRRAMAERRSGMFCLMDADKFKSINDQYGHAVGDKVIIAIAEAMKKTFRDSDIIFRLGGDEFSSFSEGVTDKEIGGRILQRLFTNINKIEIPELLDRKISLSVGVTFYPA
ncbi:MAG: GGDEF domain-containing protein, partial [Desulfovibrio sp.]|nr:GGDEF domain-containing protein [Desulfovibrio sp.]